MNVPPRSAVSPTEDLGGRRNEGRHQVPEKPYVWDGRWVQRRGRHGLSDVTTLGVVGNYLCPDCQVVLTFAPDSPAPATDAAGGVHVVTGVCPSCGGLFGRRYGEIVPVTPFDHPRAT